MAPTTRPQSSVPTEFLQAKLRGRRRRLYEGGRLEELAHCTSVKELWNDLYPRRKGTGRVALQRQVRKDRIADLCSILHLLSPDLSSFYTALVRRFQLDNILVLMRLFAGGREELDPESFVPDLPERIDISARNLLQARNLEDFLSQLPSDLTRTAFDTLDLYRSEETTAFTEMALEREWWSLILDQLGELSGQARQECSPPILFELNSARLLTTLRAGRSYHIQWDTLQPFLPPSPPQESEKRQNRLAQSTLEELFESPAPDTIRAHVSWVEEETAEDLVELENATWARTVKIADRIYHTLLDGPSILVAYFYLKRNEIQNIIETIESVYYTRQQTR